MADGRGPRQRHPVSPLDEERESRLAYGDVYANATPTDYNTPRIDSRTRNDGLAQPTSDNVDQVRSNGPAKRASGNRRGDPSPESTPIRGLAIGYSDELEIRVAERDDPVRCTPSRMTSAFNRGQPVPSLKPGGFERQVTDRQDDMVDGEHS